MRVDVNYVTLSESTFDRSDLQKSLENVKPSVKPSYLSVMSYAKDEKILSDARLSMMFFEHR